MTFWQRVKLVFAIWLGVAVALLSVGVGVAWALGGSAVIYGIAFGWAEWLTWIGK